MDAGKILITGSTGLLGRELAQLLESNGPALAGRRRPDGIAADRWREMDLLSRSGIDAALSGIDTVFHLASATKGKFDRAVDVEGTREMLRVARTTGLKHFVYVSIVGIDRIPYKYYKIKLETEKVIQDSGVPFTILRATQFHEFIDFILRGFLRFPVSPLLKAAKFQPVETAAVARALARIGQSTPLNGTRDLGGPEILDLETLSRTWLSARRLKRITFGVKAFFLGRIGRGLCDGALTTSERSTDSILWSDWLRLKYH